MLLIPRATEKSYTASTRNTYIFNVPLIATKPAIAQAVAKNYNVTVLDVKTLTRNGKSVRFSRGRHAYPGTTFRQAKKYAYVTLKAGDKIPVFEEETSANSDTAKDAKKAIPADIKKATDDKTSSDTPTIAKSKEKGAK